VLGKEPYKHMVTILTPDGVVDLKFTGEAFANYNKTISEVVKGEKKTLEKSWFVKGTLVLATGFKSGEVFRIRHLSRVLEIDDLGNVKTTKYRYGGA
jgi:DNA polymerase-3 subunit alpha